MNVTAQAGDTIDELCYRHYGSTANLVSVLEANPGLADQMFLTAGQQVEMPEQSSPASTGTVQLWD